MPLKAENSGAPTRLIALRKLLESREAGTQEELCDGLGKQGFEVTQSTVSRALRKLGAVKAIDESGRTVYRLQEDAFAPPPVQTALSDLIQDVLTNDSIIVIRTSPGSASLVARHLDHYRPGKILGTIAGDDTIFVAPSSIRAIRSTIEAIKESLLGSE